jgi:hypothetical protein
MALPHFLSIESMAYFRISRFRQKQKGRPEAAVFRYIEIEVPDLP